MDSLTRLFNKKTEMIGASEALPGRQSSMPVSQKHFVNGHVIKPPFPHNTDSIVFGLGCFWGAERRFWQLPGVYSTAVGYSGGYTPNPTYEEVCTGRTGHNEVVMVVYIPDELALPQLLQVFWESHNPTQGMRQGNDSGTQYRSGIYYRNDEQKRISEQTKAAYGVQLKAAGFEAITTEICDLKEFYYAEDYHQQYLAKNPNGYCGLGGTGVSCRMDETTNSG